jgi:hypothetical protein
MTKVPPTNFSPEPATKAKMAQRIERTASEGVTDLHVLMSAAVDEGQVPAV